MIESTLGVVGRMGGAGPAFGAVLEPFVAAVGDQHLTIRAEAALAAQGMEVVAQVEDVVELESLADVRHPHVVVLLDSPGRDDPAAIRMLATILPQSRVVVVLRNSHTATVRDALRAGADGVVVERQLALALATVVRAVSLGHAVVPLDDRTTLGREPLSPREREVLALAADGWTNASIAAHLHLAQSTIKTHLSSGFAKLGVHSRSDLPALIREGRSRRTPPPRSHDLPGDNA